MADVSRTIPISVSPRDSVNLNSQEFKRHLITGISLGVRVGQDVDIAIGFIQSLSWSVDRPVTEIHQIEPHPDGTFTSKVSIHENRGLFNTKYFPGEVVELIPGKQGAVALSLSRCVLFGSNLLSALMYIEKAGTEENTVGAAEAQGYDPANAGDNHYFAQYVTLIQQVRPVYVKQIMINPVDGSVAYGRVFEDVWIESMSEEQVTADRNSPIIESISAKATRIRPFVQPKKEPKKDK